MPTYRHIAVIPAPVRHGDEFSRQAAKRTTGGLNWGRGLENPREVPGEAGRRTVKYLPLVGT